MRIAIFTDSFLPGIGGTENVVLRLAKELSKEHDVLVVAPDYHRTYADNELPFKVIRTVSMGVSKNDFWALPALTCGLKKKIKQFNPDVIHTHTFGMMAGYANNFGRRHKIPVICTAHTKFKYCYDYSLKSKLLVSILLKHVIKRPERADRVTSVSASMIPELKSYGLKKSVTVIKNGNDPFDHDKSLVREPHKKFMILFVGLIIEYKNIGFSLDALGELKKRRDDFEFYIVGRGPGRDKFEKQVEKLGLKDNVIFTGPVTDRKKLSKMYLDADLFFFTSIFDNDGLVILEAADMNTPSLVLENTGNSERLTDGETGFIVKNDVVAAADKLEYLMDHRDEVAKVGEQAKSIFISWEEIASQYVNIYNEEIVKKREEIENKKNKKKKK